MISYDANVDVLRILPSGRTVFESDEDKPGIILDYDEAGNLIGVEILDAPYRTDNPRLVELAVSA